MTPFSSRNLGGWGGFLNVDLRGNARFCVCLCVDFAGVFAGVGAGSSSLSRTSMTSRDKGNAGAETRRCIGGAVVIASVRRCKKRCDQETYEEGHPHPHPKQ